MKPRHEWKHIITKSEALCLRQRLSAVMSLDRHAIDGKYEIRSLYFDNLYDKALREKIDGVNYREKYRLRLYNGDSGFIEIEKKSKVNGLCIKEGDNLTPEEAQTIVDGNIALLSDTNKPLLAELIRKSRTEGLKPSTLVDYTREPFVFTPGNVRVTLDYNIRTGLKCTDFLNPDCVTIPAGEDEIILEVKWDEYLPSVIRDIVQTPSTRSTSFSKYQACRIYG